MWSQVALGSITTNKASGGDGIPAELFEILKKRCWESAAVNMPANLENSAVATGLEKVSFHSKPKERKCQRMLQLPHNCTHLTRQPSNAQNSPSQASTICELWTSRCSSWFRNDRGTSDQTANIHWIIEKAMEFQKNTHFYFIDYAKVFDCVDDNKL